MTEYKLVPFHLSPIQQRKARSALKNHVGVTLRIGAHDIGHGESHLSLTHHQIEKVGHKVDRALGSQITFSHPSLIHSAKHGSGIFSSIASGGVRFLGNTLADCIGSGVKKKAKGKGIMTSIASGGVRSLGNTLADCIGSGIKHKPKPKPKKKKGKGFMKKLLSGGVRLLANTAADSISGSGIYPPQ